MIDTAVKLTSEIARQDLEQEPPLLNQLASAAKALVDSGRLLQNQPTDIQASYGVHIHIGENTKKAEGGRPAVGARRCGGLLREDRI